MKSLWDEGVMMRIGAVSIVVLAILIAFNQEVYAYDEAKCAAAVSNLEKHLKSIMRLNKQYTKVLKSAAKELKKSAKRYSVTASRVNRFVRDKRVDENEAKKLLKMDHKRHAIKRNTVKVGRKSTEILNLSQELGELYRKMSSACGQ